MSEITGGEGGIRTPGSFRPNGFQDRRDRPLCHLSVKRYETQNFLPAARLSSFLASRFEPPFCLPLPHPVGHSVVQPAHHPDAPIPGYS